MYSLKLSLVLGLVWAALSFKVKTGPRKVACIGDSITAGFGLAPGTPAWPAILQASLGTDFNVTNLGEGGRTMQKAGMEMRLGPVPWSWWDSEHFNTLDNSKWDVVVIALGTNDAKAVNWKHELCDKRPYWASCPFWSDYVSMIRHARSLGTGSESSPDIYLVIPPPLMKQGVADINQTVINSVLPELIPSLAAANGISADHVLDIFGALRGDSLQDVPASGCASNMPTVSGCGFFCDATMCDQLHPCGQGHAKIAEVVRSAILKYNLPSSLENQIT